MFKHIYLKQISIEQIDLIESKELEVNEMQKYTETPEEWSHNSCLLKQEIFTIRRLCKTS